VESKFLFILMKNIIWVLLISILLVSCSENKYTFEKKVECSKKAQEYVEKSQFKISMQDNFYSEAINSCLVIINRENSNLSLDNNLRSEDIVDSLSGNVIWRIAYDKKIGFEGSNFLPKSCDRNYSKYPPKYVAGFSIAAWNKWNMDHSSATETYKMEKIYRNCVDYLKWKNSNYEFTELGFTPTGDNPPLVWWE